MKKLLSLALAACATAGLTFLLNGCDGLAGTSGDSNPDSNVEESVETSENISVENSEESSAAHEHDFVTEWSKDETNHWHACNGECEEISDVGEHTYDESTDEEGKITKICTVCHHTVIIVPEHEHTYEGEWTFDENGHWKTCDTEDCGEKLTAEHNLLQESTHGADYIETKYTCDVCGYTKTDRITIETAVPDEKTWIDAFNELTYTNYTANVYFGEGEYAINNKVSINETSGYFLMDYSMIDGLYVEYYTELQSDGSYVTYGRTSKNGNYMLLNDKTNYYYLEIISQSLMILKYDEHYEAFTYNEEKGTYFCEEIIESIYNPDQESEEYSSKLYCKNTEIKVADGKVLSIQADYVVWYPEFMEKEYPTEEDFQSVIIYDQIGLTIITIPTAVKENALADDGWFDRYFKDDYIPDEGETSTETSNESSNEFESKENTDN